MPPPSVRIRLLGPVAIAAGGAPVRVGAPKLACVLAALALRPGTPVGKTDLIDRVWDGDPPEAVLSVLYSYIARLRTALKQVPGAEIRRAGAHGYVLELEPTAVDVHAIRALRDEAESLTRAGRSRDALDVWRSACELADSGALAGIGGRWADETRVALDAERIELLTGRYTAELDAGHHAAVLGDLAALAEAEPLTEPLTELLMLAYYRCGRPADALARFEAIRIRLRDELGADPSKPLRDLHVRILDQDPTLEPATAAPIQLPADISGFTGRTAELDALDQLAGRVPLAAVVGPGGAGKTALAVRWGHARADRFPGGLLYVNLRGFDEGELVSPREALGRLQAMITPGAVVPADLDAAAESFRAATADRGVLLILDNARNPEQVRPLLPGPGCFTIVTSRDRLTGLVALDDARPVPVGVLGRDEAVELLTRIVGAHRAEAEPEAVQRLVDLCGRLALALRIAAAHLAGEPTARIADYVAELERRDRLDVLAVDGDPAAAVTANLDLSYRVLGEGARELFARLGTLPGEDFAEELIMAVSERPEEDTLRALRGLVAAHLLERHRARRYRMHDLVRLYAARTGEQVLGTGDRSALIDRFIDWHHDRAFQPIPDEETNIFLACEALQDHPRLWRLVLPLRNLINEWRFIGQAHRLIDVATRRAELAGDAVGVFRMTSMKANARRHDGDSAAAVELGGRAVELAATLTDRERAAAGGNLGIYLFDAGDFTGSADAFVRAVDLAIASGNTRSQLIFTSSMVQVLVRLGRFDEAEAYVRSAESIQGPELAAEHRIRLWLSHAEVQLNRGVFDQAMAAADEAIAIAGQGSYGHLDLWCMQVSAQIHLHAGRPEAAREVYEEELRQARLRNMSSYEPEIMLNLAGALIDLGRRPDAVQLATEARDTWPKLSRAMEILQHLVLATAHNGVGEHELALTHATEASTAYAAMPWPARHELALLAMADAHAGLGDLEAARGRRAEADRISAPVNRIRRGQRVRRTA